MSKKTKSDTDKRTMLAGAFYDAFERRERDHENDYGDKHFYFVKDEWEDSWIHKAVQEAHGELLPDDWVYEICRCVAGRLHDYGDADKWEDAAGEIADGMVDVYNAARTRWLAARLEWGAEVDEAVEELGHSDQGNFGDIGIGQYHVIERIVQTIIQAINDQAGED